jgi:hypothetical protein
MAQVSGNGRNVKVTSEIRYTGVKEIVSPLTLTESGRIFQRN